MQGVILILVYVFTTLVAPIIAFPGIITSLTKTPSGNIVAPDTQVTFNCQANGVDVSWYVDGTRRDSSFSDYDISFDYDGANYDWNITLSTVAGIDKNNTRILCFSVGSIAGQVAIESLNITVAGPPLLPNLTLTSNDGGGLVNVSWEEPYTPDGFPIIAYTLTLHNLTSSDNITTLVRLSGNVSYHLVNISSYDTDYYFTVIAENSVGNSSEASISLPVGVVITASKSLSMLIGNFISLNCSPIVPTSEDSYTWTHVNTSTVLEEDTNVLTFPSISVEELGTYRCSVSFSANAQISNEVTLTSARPVIQSGTYPIRVSSSCSSLQMMREDIMVDVFQLLVTQFGFRPLGHSMSYFAASCDQVFKVNPDSKSGKYWIDNGGGIPVQVQCLF